MLLKNCRFVLTQDVERRVLENVDILVEGERIARIGPGLSAEGHQVIDCSKRVVMPGLINVHGHATMNFLRGVCDDAELQDWLKAVVPKERVATGEELCASARSAIVEMLRSGTTTCAEFYDPVEPFLQEARAAGIRAVLFPRLEEAKKLIAEFEQAPLSLITWGVSGHSIYRSTKEQLQEIAAFAKERGILKGMHIAETRTERFECKNKFGKLPVEYLEQIGWLDDKTLLAHAIWLTKGEVRILSKHQTRVSHNPVSNMKLASGGVAPVPEMHEAGVVVGLGTDSVASNNNLDLFEEMKVAGLLHKHHRWDPKAMPVQKLLDMATIDAAQCLHLQDRVGSIEQGKKADLITLDLSRPKLQPTDRDNLKSNLVYAASGDDVAEVFVAGRLKVKKREGIN